MKHHGCKGRVCNSEFSSISLFDSEIPELILVISVYQKRACALLDL